MSSTVTSVRIDNSVLEWLKDFASFHGKTMTYTIGEILTEKMLNEQDYTDAMEVLNDANAETVSAEEMLRLYA